MNSTPDEIDRWIQDAAKETGIRMAVLSQAEAQAILKLVTDRYVHGQSSWWWDELKLPYTQFDRSSVKLSAALPSLVVDVYLFPDYPNHEGPIYKLRAADIELLLGECPLFAYSVVSADGTWFLTESDHDVIYLCRW